MSMIPSSALLFFAVSISTLFVAHAKRKFLRPSNFPPGPKGLPLLGSVLEVNSSAPWLTFTQWASSYGDLVYCTLVGRKVLLIQTTDVANALLEQRSKVYSDRPPVKVLKEIGSEFNSALLPYGEIWRLHRKLFHHSFHAGVASDFLPTQLLKVRELVSGVYNFPDRYQRQIELYSSGLIMSAVYDYDILPNDDPLVLAAERGISAFVKVTGPSTAAILEAFPFLLKLPTWFPGGTFKRLATQAKSSLHEMIEVPFCYARDRVMTSVSKQCMVSESIKRFPKSGSESFETALKFSSATAFIAGIETTSSTLIIFVLAMMQYPRVQERAQKEIDATIGTHRLPNFDDKSSLPYVEAILRETLRWNPVFPLGLPHYTTTSDVYEGQYIPEGCVVLPNLWAMSRDEARYHNPNEFIPERFFDRNGQLNNDSVAFAFGFGRRICVGRHFADASVWIAIVHLLAMFKFMKPLDENGDEMDPNPEWSSGLVSHPLELKCRVVPRLPGMDVAKLMEMTRT